MPRKPIGVRTVTVRFSDAVFSWMTAEAAARQETITGFVRKTLNDLCTSHGWGPFVVEPPEKDAARLGLKQREYVQRALFGRSEEVRRNGAGFDRVGAESAA